MEEEIIETEEEEEEKVSSKKKPSRTFKENVYKILKYVILGIIVLVIVMGFWKISSKMYTSMVQNPADDTGTLDVYAKKTKQVPYATFNLGPISQGIIDPTTGEVSLYIRLHLILAYDGQYIDLPAELTTRTMQIKDMIRDLMSRKSYTDIKDSDGQERFTQELKSSINNVLKNGKLADIYLSEIGITPR